MSTRNSTERTRRATSSSRPMSTRRATAATSSQNRTEPPRASTPRRCSGWSESHEFVVLSGLWDFREKHGRAAHPTEYADIFQSLLPQEKVESEKLRGKSQSPDKTTNSCDSDQPEHRLGVDALGGSVRFCDDVAAVALLVLIGLDDDVTLLVRSVLFLVLMGSGPSRDQTTVVGEDGFVLYKRPETGSYVKRYGVKLDNRNHSHQDPVGGIVSTEPVGVPKTGDQENEGATCYEDLRTVAGHLHPTFKDACQALGLLGDDNELIINMRLLAMADSGVSTEQVKEFNDWVLSIGDGTAKGVPCDDRDSDLIEIPHDILIPRRNDTTDEINSRVLSLIPGHEKMGYSLLSDLNSTRYNWCIKVRVVRMWHISGVSRGKSFASTELVLADEENRSTGRRNHRLHWAEKYGQIFRLHNRGLFVLHKEFSKIAAEESANLPLYIFNFVDFEDLDSRARNADGLVDIIGQLTVMHPVVHSSSLNGPSVRRELELRDLSGRSLSVTLWGEHATSFEDEFLIQTIGSDEPVVIIFTGMQVRLFLGTPSCRSNAATKWYINIDIAEVNAFRASLQGRGSEVQILLGDADAEAGGVDEENANRKTVSELLSLNPHDNNDVRFTCHATIREIDVTNGWWYKDEPVVIPCYKLNVAIEDATGRAKIFMFGGVAEQVVRRTASELVEESSFN
ncbi:hypothetical protein U9M48_030559 [Paspalum notatum var. saurae]|uniref:Replication protein A OB domain-containing protein n=1 Tax=Paspalum notatum var. saurae TaxID=547442 RepID=A0AAQ3U399_PASNO